jgi:hypothetical protein
MQSASKAASKYWGEWWGLEVANLTTSFPRERADQLDIYRQKFNYLYYLQLIHASQ